MNPRTTFNVIYKPTGELVLEAAERMRRQRAQRRTLATGGIVRRQEPILVGTTAERFWRRDPRAA